MRVRDQQADKAMPIAMAAIRANLANAYWESSLSLPPECDYSKTNLRIGIRSGAPNPARSELPIDRLKPAPFFRRQYRKSDSRLQILTPLPATKPPRVCYRHEMDIKTPHKIFGAMLTMAAGALQAQIAQPIDLPTSKLLTEPVPGHPQRLNSLPMSMAVSPDGRYVVTVNAGYGTLESNYEQSLAVLDTRPARSRIIPTIARWRGWPGRRSTPAWPSAATEAIYTPAWARTPTRLATEERHTGNGIVVYSFTAGKVAPERFIHLPLQQLAPAARPGSSTKQRATRACRFRRRSP